MAVIPNGMIHISTKVGWQRLTIQPLPSFPAKTGKYTGKGVFTVTEVPSGTGSTKGWGKLKSGTGGFL